MARTRGTGSNIAKAGGRRKYLVKLPISIATTTTSHRANTGVSSASDPTSDGTPTPAPPSSQTSEAHSIPELASSNSPTLPSEVISRSSFSEEKSRILDSISTAIWDVSTNLTTFFSELHDEIIFEAVIFINFLHARELEKQTNQNSSLPNTLSAPPVPLPQTLMEARLLLVATANRVRALAQENDVTRGMHKPRAERLDGQQQIWYSCAGCGKYISNVRFACFVCRHLHSPSSALSASSPALNWCSETCFENRQGHQGCEIRAMEIRHVARMRPPELVGGVYVWYKCDECEKDIEGWRWSCVECDEEEDYCSVECLARKGKRRCGHEFRKVEIGHSVGAGAG